MNNIWLTSLLLLGVATSAVAQQPAAPMPPATGSPLVVEQIENGWLFAPDVRVADLDRITGVLIGAYGGYEIDHTLLVGGGGYWMANGDYYHELGYGGLVVEWTPLGDRPVAFGVRSLVGGGTATMPVTYLVPARPPQGRAGARRGDVPITGTGTRPVTVAVFDDFFIFEPQVDLLLNLSKHYRVSVGVGYRVIGGAHELNHQLGGPSGAISLRIWGN